MTMNPLPPQAYTKETLGKAFAWLQAQSENIKEMATSSDILVSLYLKAKLNGNGALERPSIQNFKSELRSLAGMMGEFEVVDPSLNLEARLQQDLQLPINKTQPQTPSPTADPNLPPTLSPPGPTSNATFGSTSGPTASSTSGPTQSSAPAAPPTMNSSANSGAPSMAAPPPTLGSLVPPESPPKSFFSTPPPPQGPPRLTASTLPADQQTLDLGLDTRSLVMIREVKNEFNLSTDLEALRLLISAGARNLRKL